MTLEKLTNNNLEYFLFFKGVFVGVPFQITFTHKLCSKQPIDGK